MFYDLHDISKQTNAYKLDAINVNFHFGDVDRKHRHTNTATFD